MIKNDFYNNFIYRLQEFGLRFLILLYSIMGMRISTIFTSLIFIIFSPILPPSFLAFKNLTKTMPEKTTWQKIKIIIGMWNNLGRNLAEFIFFNRFSNEKIQKYIEIDEESKNNLNTILNNKHGDIIFSAHFGNWELLTKFSNIQTIFIYRRMNNKYVNDLVLSYRNNNNQELVEKSENSALKIMKALRNGKKLAILVDQRLSNGIDSLFFNLPAKTSDAVSMFAIKLKCNVYSIATIRKNFYSSKFIITIKKFNLIDTGDLEKDIVTNTQNINNEIEYWIRNKPEQWFWVHDRWKK